MNKIKIPDWDNDIAERGVVYIAVNKTSDTMAAKSAASFKKHNPGIPVLIFTDQDTQESIFDFVVRIPSRSNEESLRDKPSYPNQGIIAKATYIRKLPFRYTLFLDIDTYVCAPVMELFDALSEFGFDFCCATDEAYMRIDRYEIPECFQRFNTGVMALAKNDKTKAMLNLFWDRFLCGEFTANEECPFSAAVYATPGIRIVTLPSEYDCRFIFPYILRNPVKILHGRSDDYESLKQKINKHPNTYRVMQMGDMIASYEPGKGFIKH